MLKLLQKEIRLVMHPTVPMFFALAAMVLIPNYPYYVSFFYTGLAFFFTCLNGRENSDIAYTLLLPVRKADVVKARFLLAIGMQLVQAALVAGFIWLRTCLHLPPNQVGMEANLAMIGLSFVMMGLFNWVFFSIYYRNTDQVGKAFAWSSVVVFGFMLVAETLAHVAPFFRDRLDTPDPAYLPQKLAVLAAGLLFYAALTAVVYRRCVRSFDALDQ